MTQPNHPSSKPWHRILVDKLRGLLPSSKKSSQPATAEKAPFVMPAEPEVNPWEQVETAILNLRQLNETSHAKLVEIESKVNTLMKSQIAWDDIQFQLNELHQTIKAEQQRLDRSLSKLEEASKDHSAKLEQMQNLLIKVSWIGGALVLAAIVLGCLDLLILQGHRAEFRERFDRSPATVLDHETSEPIATTP